MKKRIATLIIILLTTYQGISQTYNDSVTCIPNTKLRRAIILIERGKVSESQLMLKEAKIYTLEQIIINQDSTIKEFGKRDSILVNMVMNYKKIAENDLTMIKNLKYNETLYVKQLRRQKFKKWITLFAGVGIGYLITK